MASEALLDRLADAYQQGFSRIQIAAEAAAIDAWYSLDSFDSDDEEEWNAALWLIVSGAALAAAALVTGYIQRQFEADGISVVVPDPNLEWLEGDFDVWKASTGAAARIGISQGLDPRQAMEAGATRVSKLMSAAIRESEQRALDDFIESLGDFDVEVTYTEVDAPGEPRRRPGKVQAKWRRITQQGACGWCEVVADRIYSQKAKDAHPLGPFHNYCRCTWRKLTDREVKAFEPRLAGGEWRGVIDRRSEVTD